LSPRRSPSRSKSGRRDRGQRSRSPSPSRSPSRPRSGSRETRKGVDGILPSGEAGTASSAPPGELSSGESDEEGPAPLPMVGPTSALSRTANYGEALRKGEGEAIAEYVKQGARIPRRGEIGLTGEEIEQFEEVGYVMSGNRHKRMNAVRLRKENQVMTAEEKAQMILQKAEQLQEQERRFLSELKAHVDSKIKKRSKASGGTSSTKP